MNNTPFDPDKPPASYSWLAHIPPISAEELPRPSTRAPLVHEGYISAATPSNSFYSYPSAAADNATSTARLNATVHNFESTQNGLANFQHVAPGFTDNSRLNTDLFSTYPDPAEAHSAPNPHHGYGQQAPVPTLQVRTEHEDSRRPPTEPGEQIWGTARTASQDGFSSDDDMSMDEEEGLAVSRAMMAGALSATASPGKRGRPPSNADPMPTKKRRKKGTGARGGWSKGMKIGPRAAIEPTPEFNRLHQEALNAFIDEQNTEQARDLILQAIAINPEIYAAHALLSEIYFSRDEKDKAIAALFSGAHSAPRDAEVWRQVATACLQHSAPDRQVALQQASYCYARIIHNDGRDLDARLERAAVGIELGNYGKALKDLETVLDAMPRNANVMKQIAQVGIESKNTARAKALYEDLIEYSKHDTVEGESPFTWAHAVVYVHLLTFDGPGEEVKLRAISVLKQLSRWLLGRDEEFFWDDVDDDREWDADDDPRRLMVPQHIPGIFPAETYGPGLPLELRVRLGVLRLTQTPYRLDEALDHFEWLEPEARDEFASVYEFPDLFLETAKALYTAKQHEQALRYFEALRDINAYSDVDFWLGIATCYYVTGEKRQAIECYEAAKEADSDCGEARTQLAKLYTDFEEKEKAVQNAREAIRIAEKATPTTEKRRYERKEQRLARKAAENALKQAYKLAGPLAAGVSVERSDEHLKRHQMRQLARGRRPQRPRKDRPPPKPGPQAIAPLPPRKKPMTPAEKDAYRTETVTRLYNLLLENAELMREGDELATTTWEDCAASLVMDFRSNRPFYPYDRSAPFRGFGGRAKPTDQVESSWDRPSKAFSLTNIAAIPTVYREIPFTIWLDILLEYALFLANSGNQARCYTNITAALDCAVWYHDPNAQLLIYSTYLACCVALRDEATLFGVVLRWFMRTYQFNTDAYRLFAAMNLVFPYSYDKNGKEGQLGNAVFRNGPTQKFMFRQIMSMDLNLPADYEAEGFGPVPAFMRRTGEQIRKDDAKANLGMDGDLDDEEAAGSATTTPLEMDVVLLTLYGHILYAGGSFPSALSYFFRALDVEPTNHVVLLSIALSYLHEMMKRQNENRHLYLLQAWTFFEKYADARRAWVTQAEQDTGTETGNGMGLGRIIEAEIEFNRARCWHMLGLSDLAIRAYKKVLALQKDQDPTKSDDGDEPDAQGEYTMEAAYAIQTMYALNGNPAMARAITEKYLVV